jgi:hypothetical protein
VFYTIGSFGAEEIFKFSQTRAQLLRLVVKSGRRTIRCPLSPRSRSAPTVRPTLVFLHRRFIRHYTDALVPTVITVRRDSNHSNPNRSRPLPSKLVHRHPLCLWRFLSHTCAPRAIRRPSAVLRARRRPSAVLRARRRPSAPPTLVDSARARQGRPPRVSAVRRFPAVRRRGASPACSEGCARTNYSHHSYSSSPFLCSGEEFPKIPLYYYCFISI